MIFKVCGMRNAENIRALWSLEPSHIGMIFYEDSSRYVEEELTGFPFHSKDSNPINTGVFVDASLKYIRSKIKSFKLRSIQLHGQESPDLCQSLKEEGMQVIKVFRIGEGFDFAKLKPYLGVVDYFLFDTKGAKHGGNGVVFDWRILDNYKEEIPFILSGGLSMENLDSIKDFFKQDRSKRCVGLDLNSGFEILPGLKDIELIKNFKTQLYADS